MSCGLYWLMEIATCQLHWEEVDKKRGSAWLFPIASGVRVWKHYAVPYYVLEMKLISFIETMLE